MPEQTYAQLITGFASKNFAANQLQTVYLITGSDDSLKRELLKKLLDLALDPSFADFDRETIDLGPGSSVPDGENDPVPRILSAAGMAPFMSARRVVVVTSIQRLPRERQNALAAGIKQLGAVSLLILIADTPEMEAGRPKGKQLEASFKKTVATVGTVVNCESPQAGDLKQRAVSLFESWGKTAAPGVTEAISSYASGTAANFGGGAVSILTKECEKLRSYVGDRTQITMFDTNALLPEVAEENIFKLLDAIGARNTRQALDYLDAMLNVGDKPDGVAARTIVMLQRHFRLLMLGKFVTENRIDPRNGVSADVKEMLSSELASTLTGQAYRIPQYSRQAGKFTWDELIWSTSRILATDLILKGIVPEKSLGIVSPATGDDPAGALRMLVAQLASGIK